MGCLVGSLTEFGAPIKLFVNSGVGAKMDAKKVNIVKKSTNFWSDNHEFCLLGRT